MPHGGAGGCHRQGGQDKSIGGRYGDQEVTDCDQAHAPGQHVGAAVMEHVHEKAAGHAGDAAGELPDCVKQSGL